MNPFEGVPEDLERRVTLADRMLYELVKKPKSYEDSLLRVFTIWVMCFGLTFIAALFTLLFVWVYTLIF